MLKEAEKVRLFMDAATIPNVIRSSGINRLTRPVLNAEVCLWNVEGLWYARIASAITERKNRLVFYPVFA